MKTALLLLFGSLLAVPAAAQTKGENFHMDKEYPMNLSGTIKMNISDAKVTVTGSNRTTARVKIDREVVVKGWFFGKQEFSVTIDNPDGNLDLREHYQSSYSGVVGYYNEKYTINLEVPLGASLDINGDDGHYYIRNVNGAIELDVDDARIELTGCKGEDFRFKLDDGRIAMDEGKGSLRIDGKDADVKIEHGNFTKVTADLDDGDFVLETVLTDASDFNIKVEDGTADLRVLNGGGNFSLRHSDGHVHTFGNFQQTEKTDNSEKYTLNKGKANVFIRADDGKINLSAN